MLVLSRKLQQQIHLGDHITVTILQVSGNTVRIGIDAPREVKVLRGELLAKLAGGASTPPAESTRRPQAQVRQPRAMRVDRARENPTIAATLPFSESSFPAPHAALHAHVRQHRQVRAS